MKKIFLLALLSYSFLGAHWMDFAQVLRGAPLGFLSYDATHSMHDKSKALYCLIAAPTLLNIANEYGNWDIQREMLYNLAKYSVGFLGGWLSAYLLQKNKKKNSELAQTSTD